MATTTTARWYQDGLDCGINVDAARSFALQVSAIAARGGGGEGGAAAGGEDTTTTTTTMTTTAAMSWQEQWEAIFDNRNETTTTSQQQEQKQQQECSMAEHMQWMHATEQFGSCIAPLELDASPLALLHDAVSYFQQQQQQDQNPPLVASSSESWLCLSHLLQLQSMPTAAIGSTPVCYEAVEHAVLRWQARQQSQQGRNNNSNKINTQIDMNTLLPDDLLGDVLLRVWMRWDVTCTCLDQLQQAIPACTMHPLLRQSMTLVGSHLQGLLCWFRRSICQRRASDCHSMWHAVQACVNSDNIIAGAGGTSGGGSDDVTHPHQLLQSQLASESSSQTTDRNDPHMFCLNDYTCFVTYSADADNDHDHHQSHADEINSVSNTLPFAYFGWLAAAPPMSDACLGVAATAAAAASSSKTIISAGSSGLWPDVADRYQHYRTVCHPRLPMMQQQQPASTTTNTISGTTTKTMTKLVAMQQTKTASTPVAQQQHDRHNHVLFGCIVGFFAVVMLVMAQWKYHVASTQRGRRRRRQQQQQQQQQPPTWQLVADHDDDTSSEQSNHHPGYQLHYHPSSTQSMMMAPTTPPPTTTTRMVHPMDVAAAVGDDECARGAHSSFILHYHHHHRIHEDDENHVELIEKGTPT